VFSKAPGSSAQAVDSAAAGAGISPGMDIAALVIATASAVTSAVVVLALFVWAARKDGERDRAVQEQTGIRRRTRLGR
jgi:hypothetical protein